MPVANITWNYVPGSLSTLVEYRESGDITWITPSYPANPTTINSYSLTIDEDTYYDVRLTTNGISCGPRSTTFQIVAGSGECCPPGYTLSLDSSYCYQINTTAATPPTSPENAVKVGVNTFAMCGTLVYDPGYIINGNGTYVQINTSVAFWKNSPSICTAGNTTNGPFNRNSIWSPTTAPGQIVGFSFCIDIPETKVYYIGMGFDNLGTIRLNGQTLLQTGNTTSEDPLLHWKIYPVTIPAGSNVLEVIGQNTMDPLPNPAAIGVEIYDNTAAEIIASTGYGGLTIIFRSLDYVGQPIQIGNEGIGYTCPAGYSLVLCDGPAYCTQTLTTPTIICPPTTTTTTTTTTSSTTTTTTTSP